MKPEERKQMLHDTRQLIEVEDKLEALGYEERVHYYTEEVYDVTVYYEVEKGYVCRENEDPEDCSFEDGDTIDINEMHHDKRVIGYLIVTTGGEVVDLDVLNEVRAFYNERCAVCGSGLVLSDNDHRIELDGPKCFDHRGVEVEVPLKGKKRDPPPLPVVGKPRPVVPERPAKMGVLC